jgi:hypothetical protein
LQSYQLHVHASDGSSGQLTLVDIAIEDRKNSVLDPSTALTAFNVERSQMLASVQQHHVAARGTYLATFTFRVSDDAAGRFVIDVSPDEANGNQTVLINNDTNRIAISSTDAGLLHVVSRRTAKQSFLTQTVGVQYQYA